jgi:hypothetical protein
VGLLSPSPTTVVLKHKPVTASAAPLQERVQRVRTLLPEAYALRQDSCSNLQDVFDMVAEVLERDFMPTSGVIRDIPIKAQA